MNDHSVETFLFFRFGRFVAGLGLVASDEFVDSCGAANEALRFGAIMFFAPVTGLLEFCNQRFVALGTLFFGHAVLDAPPTPVTVIDIGHRRCPGGIFLHRLTLAATTQHDHAQ